MSATGMYFAVKELEKARFSKQEKDDQLIYSDILAGSVCDVIYQFNENDKLVSGIYLFIFESSSSTGSGGFKNRITV